MAKKNRFLAALLAIAVCFVMLFSVCYIAAHAEHYCIGEDCPICYQLNVCENALKTLGVAAVVAVFTDAVIYSAVLLSAYAKKRRGGTTLILLKIKLSN